MRVPLLLRAGGFTGLVVNRGIFPIPFSSFYSDVAAPAARSGPLRVCVIGSGPAGFYTAHHLLKRHKDTKVDILERFPVPFGLVRFGVAPDHPDVKNCINQFTTLAESGNCRFIGNIALGKDFDLSQLLPSYHAIVMAYGAEGDHKLHIPGEELPGVYSARAFVGWYNGLPAHRELNPDLSGEVAVLIGHGNVALDVARILLTPTHLLENTDICDHALKALRASRIRRVHLIGRRGPLQVAFTIKELREMTRLPDCKFWSDHTCSEDIRGVIHELSRPRKRLTELLMKTLNEPVAMADESSRREEFKECSLSYLRSPVEVLTDKTRRHVTGLRMELNKLEGDWKSSRAIGTGHYEELQCNMVLRSIGYRSLPIEGVPFDDKAGIIPNIAGRISQGLYCSGWVKTGPVGVILNTIDDSCETAETILNDYKKGILVATPTSDDIVSLLQSKPGVFPTFFSDWMAIDRVERSKVDGQKPREKIVSIADMLRIIKASRGR